MEPNKKKRILTLSASKIALWYNCQMAFYLRYVEHAEAKESMVLTFGKSIHSLLNQFYKKIIKVLKVLLSILNIIGLILVLENF